MRQQVAIASSAVAVENLRAFGEGMLREGSQHEEIVFVVYIVPGKVLFLINIEDLTFMILELSLLPTRFLDTETWTIVLSRLVGNFRVRICDL